MRWVGTEIPWWVPIMVRGGGKEKHTTVHSKRYREIPIWLWHREVRRHFWGEEMETTLDGALWNAVQQKRWGGGRGVRRGLTSNLCFSFYFMRAKYTEVGLGGSCVSRPHEWEPVMISAVSVRSDHVTSKSQRLASCDFIDPHLRTSGRSQWMSSLE